MKSSEVLRAALAKLGANGENWIRKAAARDERGRVVGACAPSATCWCSIGAIKAVVGGGPIAEPARFLREVVHDGYVAGFNDAPQRRFPEIKQAFEKAIALAEKSERLVA